MIPAGTTGKMLDVKHKTDSLIVKHKTTGELIIEGKWYKPIKNDETIWSIIDEKGQKFLQLTIEKNEGQNWWNTVL